MHEVNIYLNFNGNCEEAFGFYKSVFGGDFTFMGRYKDMPESERSNFPDDHLEKIMHVSLPLKNMTLMGSDVGGEWASNFTQGTNYSVSIRAFEKSEADRLFNELSDGGNVQMPMMDTFWGDYFGVFTDKFGINWMISFNENEKPGH